MTAGSVPPAADLLGRRTLPGLRGHTKGIARIQCTNPDCKADYFHHDRRLYGEISTQVYRMIQSFSSAAVIPYASAGEFARWNPHLQTQLGIDTK